MALDELIGNIYQWGDWESGWMGKNIVVNVDKKYIYLKSVYRIKDITFIKKEVKLIDKDWYIKKEEINKVTHKEFERKLKSIYTFLEKINYSEK